MRLHQVMVVVFCTLFLASGTFAGETIGSIKIVSGDAAVKRQGGTLSAQAGMHLEQNDVLTTGSNGAMGVIMRDNSVLSMGADSEIVLNEFVFAPASGQMSSITKMTKGTATFLSGQMSKIKPDSVRFETPSAVMGFRGTRILVKVKPD